MAKFYSEELKKRVLRLRARGESYRIIASIISEEFPDNYSHMWVKKLCDKYDSELAKAIAENPTVREEFVKDIEIEQRELAKIRSGLWDCIDESKSVTEKVKAYRVLLNTISSKLKTLEKIHQDVTQEQKQKRFGPEDIESIIQKTSIDVLRKILKEKEREEMKQYA